MLVNLECIVLDRRGNYIPSLSFKHNLNTRAKSFKLALIEIEAREVLLYAQQSFINNKECIYTYYVDKDGNNVKKSEYIATLKVKLK